MNDGATDFPFDVELALPSIGAVVVGGSADQLRSLGRPLQVTDDGLFLSALGDGLTISTEAGVVTGFVLYWRFPVSFIQGNPFLGRVFDDGRLLPFTRETTVEQVLALLGAPYWRDDRFRYDGSGDNTLPFYERGAVELQIGFCDGGRLYDLIVCSPPMLADEGQRQAYGVTRIWPPD